VEEVKRVVSARSTSTPNRGSSQARDCGTRHFIASQLARAALMAGLLLNASLTTDSIARLSVDAGAGGAPATRLQPTAARRNGTMKVVLINRTGTCIPSGRAQRGTSATPTPG